MPSENHLIPPFVRDTAIAAVAYVLVLAPTLYEVDPEILRAPGYVLYIPLVLVYASLGGELENAHGPGLLAAAVFVLALALLTAGIARVLRRRFGVGGETAVRAGVVGIAAVGGTAAVLLGLAALGNVFPLPTPQSVGLLVGGIAAIAGSAWYAGRSPST